jgi:uncharacterized protein YjbI with pentapeptide repeats
MTSEQLEDAERDRRGESLRAEFAAGTRDFSHRVVTGARVGQTEFTACDFGDTQFVDCVFYNAGFEDSRFVRTRFDRCNVQKCRFHRADLSHAVLGPAAFVRSDFYLATLRHTNFHHCDASDAYFGQADLREASLWGGRFRRAWFLFTFLDGCTLVGADFEGAIVRNFNFIRSATLVMNAALLQQTLGERKRIEAALDRATPASLALAEALMRAHLPAGEAPMQIGRLAEHFVLLEQQFEHLRRFLLASGCKPDEVAAMTSAANQKRDDYPRVFISYSSADETFTAQFYEALTTFGVDAWFAPENMRGGRKIHEQLEAAIAERDKIILVLSDNSMKSPWVVSEVQWAADREIKSGQQILFPIRIVPFDMVRRWTLFDSDLGQDVAKYVRQYFVPDFTSWRDREALARQTERFLGDLRNSSIN